jgi:hypothetical protein
MLLKVCVCHILEKSISLNIFSKIFIHLISKFCSIKWLNQFNFIAAKYGDLETMTCLEKVHLEFCKMILNLKTSTPNYMIYGEFILEKSISLNIFSKIFIHLISKFCCEYKWCDKLYIMHDILDCFPQIIFAQKEIINDFEPQDVYSELYDIW